MNESGEFVRGRQPAGFDRMREKVLIDEQRQKQRDAKQKERKRQLLAEDRTVTIPSTATVGRLATIFGFDLCE